jgi:hypothetical protein
LDRAILITPPVKRPPITPFRPGEQVSLGHRRFTIRRLKKERQTKLILDVAVLQPKNRLDLELMRANKAGNPQTGAAGRTSHKTVLFGKG